MNNSSWKSRTDEASLASARLIIPMYSIGSGNREHIQYARYVCFSGVRLALQSYDA